MTRPAAARAGDGATLVDGHVHLYPRYDRGVFFASAVANFRAAARECRLPAATPGCLLLTETPDVHAFAELRASAAGAAPSRGGEWTPSPTAESCSLLLERGGAAELVLIAGRQIATRDGLEVLAIGVSAEFPRSLSFEEAIAATRQAGGMPILPWGFGKWWFGRGARVSRALASPERPLFLGDNGGRLHLLPRPRHFARGHALGIPTLPGSDPLPFDGEERRVGSCGFVLPGPLERSRPAAALRRLLSELSEQPPAFGRLERLPGFMANQLRLQARKRLGTP